MDAPSKIIDDILGKHSRSAQPESQQLVAVALAIKEVVLSEKLEATPTSFFAAAMSALEQPATQSTHQTCAAVFAFLGFILPRVPNGILRAKFVGCTAVIGKALEAHRSQVWFNPSFLRLVLNESQQQHNAGGCCTIGNPLLGSGSLCS